MNDAGLMGRPLDRRAIRASFDAVVNLTADELAEWLQTEESRAVGFSRDGGESVGHAWRWSLMNWGHDPLK